MITGQLNTNRLVNDRLLHSEAFRPSQESLTAQHMILIRKDGSEVSVRACGQVISLTENILGSTGYQFYLIPKWVEN